MMKKLFTLLLLVTTSLAVVQAQNVGIGTASPGTKLDINGALTTRDTTISISGSATIPTSSWSIVRVTGTLTAAATITGPTPPNSGMYLTLYNSTTGGYSISLNGVSISNGKTQTYIYEGGAWQATSAGNAATTSNALSSSGNTLTSTVNGVAATAPAVNTVSNTTSGNTISTTVNGVAGTAVSVPNIYTADGTLTGTRTVTQGANDLTFSSTTGNLIYNPTSSGKLGVGTATPGTKLDVSGSFTTRDTTITISGAATIPTTNWSLVNVAGTLTAAATITGPTPANAGMYLILYNGTTGGYDIILNGTNIPGSGVQTFVYEAGAWRATSTPATATAWSLTGNTGTTAGATFLGTTDLRPLLFKVANIKAGSLDPTSTNTSLGVAALNTITGVNNSALGLNALRYASSADNNTAMGSWVMLNNSTGSYNTALGSFTLYSNTTGNNNVALGQGTLYGNTTGNDNTATGYKAMENNTTGNSNTAVGKSTMATNTIGSNNTTLGYGSDVAANNLTNATAVGANAAVGASNSLVLGSIKGVNGATVSTSVGIGTTTPGTKLDVSGSVTTRDTTISISGSATIPTSNWSVINVTGTLTAAATITGPTPPNSGMYLTLYNNTAGGYSITLNGTTVPNGNIQAFIYEAGAWRATSASAAATAWSLTGNSGTTPGTNFVGTTDAQSLTFKVNNTKAGYLDQTSANNTSLGVSALNAPTGTNNSALGNNALQSNTTGSQNTAVGQGALTANTTGDRNAALGQGAMTNNSTGYYNTAVGQQAMNANTTGIQNVAVGQNAMYTNTIGVHNSAVGQNSMFSNTTGAQNTAVGQGAMYSNTSGNINAAVGQLAMFSNTTGNQNTAVGQGAMYTNTTGSTNAAVGQLSMYNNTTGTANTGMGQTTLYANTTGFQNTAVGQSAMSSNTTGVRNAALGSAALSSNVSGASNTAIGQSSIINNTSGGQNTAVGQNTMVTNTIGSSNTTLGYGSDVAANNLTNATAVGANAYAGASNSVVIGSINGVNGATASSSVGIGTTTPGTKVDINGSVTTRDTTISISGSATIPTSNWSMIKFTGTLSANATITGPTPPNNGMYMTLYNNTTGGKTIILNGTSVANGGVQTFVYEGAWLSTSAAAASGTAWNITGNSGTSTSTNYIGTSDNTSLTFKINGTRAGYLDVTSNDVTIFGASALLNNSSGTNVAAFGDNALQSNTSGSNNVAMGQAALTSNTTGGRNTGIGVGALRNNTTGDKNTALGNATMPTNTTGTYNTTLGYGSDVASSALTNATAVGANAQAGASNTLVLGAINGVNGSTVSTNVGIGTTTPTSTLQVAGKTSTTNLQMTNGATNGYIMQGDASGNATWVPQGSTAWTLTGNSGTTPGTNYIGTSDNTSLMFKINGARAGYLDATASDVTIFGGSALLNNSSGTAVAAFGDNALEANTTGSNNAAVGSAALTFNTTGSNNTAMGVRAIRNNTTGDKNTALGKDGMLTNTTGTYNTTLGYGADVASSGLTNATAVGANAQAGASNTLVLGAINGVNGSTVSTNVGIGTTTPTSTLQVAGKTTTTNLQMTNGATNGYVLQSDASGNATWVSPSSVATTHTLTNATNTISSTVNGVTATAPAVNTVTNTVSGNTVATTVNGVAGTAVTVPNIYTADGTLTGSRTVTEGANNLTFSSTTGNLVFNPSSTGKVGIGTTSPTALLDVTNSSTADTRVNILNTNTTSGSVGLDLRSSSSGAWQYIDFANSSTSNTGSGTPDYTNRIYSNNSNFVIASPANGNNIVVNNTSGNVGIGTATPSSALQVAGKTTTTNLQMTTGAGSGYVLLSDASGNASWVAPPTLTSVPNIYTADGTLTGTRTVTQGANDLTFSSTTGNLIYNPSSTGKVGIGITTPVTPLHVQGNTADILKIQNPAMVLGAKAYIDFLTYGLTNAGVMARIGQYDNGNATGSLLFEVNNSGVANSSTTNEAMRIISNGNVGIGTTTPSSTLQVAGKTTTTNLQMTNGATNGYVLQSDASGNASWVAPSSVATTNTLTNATNTISSTVNGVTATAPAVNTVTNTVSGNTVSTTVNGVAGTAVTVPNIYTADGTLTGARTVTQAANNLTFSSTSGNLLFNPTSGGKVGIGNTNPISLLANTSSNTLGADAQGPANGGLAFTWANSATTGNGYAASIYNASTSGAASVLALKGAGTTSANGLLDISTGAQSTTGTTVMRVNGDGKVGIGNISPASQLANTNFNILGSDGAGFCPTALTWTGSSSSSGYTALFHNPGTGVAYNGLAVKVAGTTSSNSLLDLSTGTSPNATGTPVMRVNGDGKVGIGTTSPGTRLDVSGSFTTRDTTITISGAATIPTTNWSVINVGGTLTAAATITGPTPTNTGMYLTLYNNTTGGFGIVLNSVTIPGGKAQSFIYENGGWQAINSIPLTNIYNTDGTLTGSRTVTQGANNLTFSSTTGNLIFNPSSTGRVGIGTTNPLQTLAVNNASGLYSNTEFQSHGIAAQTGTTAGTDQILYMGADKTNHVGYIQSVLYGSAVSSLVLNARGGAVGIGTSAPAAALDVESGAILVGGGASTHAQGAHLEWNKDGIGGTWLLNQKGLGAGGFHFGEVTSANAVTERMTITGSGAVGIGTTSPTGQLANTSINIVGVDSYGENTNSLTWSQTGNGYTAGIYNASTASGSNGLVVKTASTSGSAILDLSTGTTPGSPGTPVMRVLANGNVGIGTSNPGVALDVQTGPAISVSNYGYLNSGGTAAYFGGTQTPIVSIRASGRIVSAEFNAVSDKRIKTNIRSESVASMLDKADSMRVVSYQYIDKHNKGARAKTGFIAQELEQVLPGAITQSTDVIPNVYAAARGIEVHDSTLTIITDSAHGFAEGDEIRLYGDKNTEYNVTVACVKDGHTFTVEGWKGQEDCLFVYGKKVSDFHSVDFDQVTALAIGAIQELNKKVKALEKENAALRDINDKIQSSDAEQTKLIQTMKAQIDAINEKMGINANR